MEKVSKFLTDYIIRKGMVDEEDRNMYEYGFVITMEVGLFVIFCLIMTLQLHMFINGILFFIVFVPLRSYSGGLHLEKYHSCLILSCVTFLGILMIVKHIKMPMWVSFVILVILTIFVYILYSIVKGNKTQSNKTLSVLVTNMLEDDGTSSDYMYSWWQVVNTTDGVTINSGTKVLKGTSCQIPLSRRTGTNKKLSVSVKGNTNNLDTILSATIFDFNK